MKILPSKGGLDFFGSVTSGEGRNNGGAVTQEKRRPSEAMEYTNYIVQVRPSKERKFEASGHRFSLEFS